MEITETCDPAEVEKGGDIVACLCTEDFCNDVDGDLALTGLSGNRTEEAEEVVDEINISPTVSEVTETTTTTTTSTPTRLRCHQCGSLFSGQNSDCETFDENDESQRGYCEDGQACLYYSWQKTQAV